MGHFQQEQLASALDVLCQWQPLLPLSKLEMVVNCQVRMLEGKILRYKGCLAESIACLRNVQETISRDAELVWDEDGGLLVYELASALLDCDQTAEAKGLLQEQLQVNTHTADTQALLRISLAECCFSESEFSAARVHLDVVPDIARKMHGRSGSDESLAGLSKVARVCYAIGVAKLEHMAAQSEDPEMIERAMLAWSSALVFLTKIPPGNRRAAMDMHRLKRILLLDLMHIVEHDVDEHERMRKMLDECSREIARLRVLSEGAEATHWIPGLAAWNTQLARWENEHNIPTA